jgi:CheY-like chemotaxis protein
LSASRQQVTLLLSTKTTLAGRRQTIDRGFIVMAAGSETHCGSAPGVPFLTSSNADDLLRAGASNLNGLRVLVVEDSWQVSAALKGLLEAWGADVAGPVATVADAARLVSERRIDVALVDINLRGGELAYDLIDQLHGQGIRIVVVTGYADVSIDEKKVAAVLQKPISGPLLLQSLRPAA